MGIGLSRVGGLEIRNQEAGVDTRALVGARALRVDVCGDERDEESAHIVSERLPLPRRSRYVGTDGCPYRFGWFVCVL